MRLSSPRLLLGDEATGNPTPRNKGHILELLLRSVEAHGATLLATHVSVSNGELKRLYCFDDCHVLFLMEKGKVTGYGI
jgi:ABC-type lipoprotein export system ATPase subunit